MKKYAILLIALILLLSSLLFYLKEPDFEKGLYLTNENNELEEILKELMPEEKIFKESYSSLYPIYLEEDNIVQIYGDIIDNIPKNSFYYPLFYSNVVIALDRDNFHGKIESWEDLFNSNCKIVIPNEFSLTILSTSYIVSENPGNNDKVINFLKKKHENRKLRILKLEESYLDIDEKDTVILFDHEAKFMKRINPNIEIIHPIDGSVYFETGLLSPKKLEFDENHLYNMLKEKDFIIPGEIISNSTNAKEIGIKSRHLQNISEKFYRQVMRQRFLSPANGRERAIIYPLLIVLLIFWGNYSFVRINDKTIRKEVLIISYLMSFWCLVKLLKGETNDTSVIHIYLWYLFYVGIIFICLLSIWITLSVEKSMDMEKLYKFKKYSFALSMLLFISIITNNYHNLYFVFDSSYPRWDYSYGPLFILILIWEFIGIVFSQLILLYKAKEMPAKKALIGPVLISLFLLIYSYLYKIRLNNIISNDVTFTSCTTIMVAFELSMRFGLIPINKKYNKIFKSSTVAMEIYDNDNNLRYTSSNPLDKEDVVYYKKPIQGGYVRWCKDFKEIKLLDSSIEEKNNELEEKYNRVKEQYLISEKLTSLRVKSSLINEVEKNISNELTWVSDKLNQALKLKDENRKDLLSLISYKILRIKQKSISLMNSLINGNLKLEDVLLSCHATSKMAERFSTKSDLFIEGDCNFSFEEVRIICDWFSDSLENTFNKNVHIVGNFVYKNSTFRLNLFSDLSDDLENNPFEPTEEIRKEIIKTNFKLHCSVDDDGYRGIHNLDLGGK